MQAICQFEEEYVTPYMKFPCPAQTLPFYICALRNKNCSELTDDDLDITLQLLERCQPYYEDGDLTHVCGPQQPCLDVPRECLEHGAVFKILHYLTDTGFPGGDRLLYTMLFFPQSSDYVGIRDYFWEELKDNDLSNDLVYVEAMELNIAMDLMDPYLKYNMRFFLVALLLIAVLSFLYLCSCLMMLAVFLSIPFALTITYLVYYQVFRVPDFSHINLLTGILVIGIAADDVFVIYKLWQKERAQHPDLDLKESMARTLSHGALSIFITSFTTASALYANLISNITAIRYFAIFSGTSILMCFVFVITAVPALIVISERYSFSNVCGKCHMTLCETVNRRKIQVGQALWGRFIPYLVTHFWPVWVGISSTIGVIGTVIVLVYPQFQHPDSPHIRLYQDNHPSEIYQMQVRDHFGFEGDIFDRQLHVQWLWGLDGIDTGNHMDPEDRGSLNLDGDFDISNGENLRWHLDFCHHLLDQNFIYRHDTYKCTLESFQDLITQPCSADSVTKNVSQIQCCGSDFPSDSTTFKYCITNEAFLTELYSGPRYLMGNFLLTQEGDIVIVQYFVSTTFVWIAAYDDQDAIYKELNRFTKSELNSAPAGSQNGWFSTTGKPLFMQYDMQNALLDTLYQGLCLAMMIGFTVLLFTSSNVVLTLYALLTIILILTTTLAALILQGWQLFLTETLPLTIAVGLPLDFTIHFSVAYRLSGGATRKSRVHDALGTVGSAVTMAAMTTFVAGAVIAVSTDILAFRRFGSFLMIVMAVSLIFAIFYFLPLCTFIGPMRNIGELTALCCCARCRESKESNLGNESAETNNAEMHELTDAKLGPDT